MLDYRAPALLRRKRASLLLAARSGRTTAAALQPTNFSKRDRVVICVVSVDFGRECLCRRAHNTSPPHDYLHMPRSLVSPYLIPISYRQAQKVSLDAPFLSRIYDSK
jgi:hypothetical protein